MKSLKEKLVVKGLDPPIRWEVVTSTLLLFNLTEPSDHQCLRGNRLNEISLSTIQIQ